MATDTSVPLNEFVAALATLHRAVSQTKPRSSYGRREKRDLDARFENVLARAADLTVIQAVGLDWLDENQHVIREAIAQIAGNLPPGYVRKLPAIESAGGGAELRIGAVARCIVERTALPLDIDRIDRFLALYQRMLPLALGELWALPTLLRAEIVRYMCDTAEQALDLAQTDLAESEISTVSAALSACVISLRTLAATDWLKFVERQSVVEQLLNRDPARAYSDMTPESRNHYREQVERLARKLGKAEARVANAAIELANTPPPGALAREQHVGYYLIDRGVDQLTAGLLGRPRFHRPFWRLGGSWKLGGYLTAIGLPAAVSTWLFSRFLAATPVGTAGFSLLVFFAVIPALTIWTEIVNWFITQAVPPRVLPKLNFSRGVPRDRATAVAIPCMLTNSTEIDRLVHSLELNYLGNHDSNLVFVLLSDHTDADNADLKRDRVLLQRVQSGIDTLNARYGSAGREPFALLHRRRLWNASAGVWMGWERKRGKIDEFNRWLLGAEDTSFDVLHGAVDALRSAKYVITLDADNQLLPNAAAELIGALAHPLNHPEFGSTHGGIRAGHTVIQPRVELDPTSANRTPFSRLMSGDVGIDLYHLAVSEAYHDFFGQGIYAGKGIYEVRAFSRSVAGSIPPNTVLSHDLLEGLLGRAALASDIVVLENASPNLAAELKRAHRWIRGDWQLLPWIFGAGSNGARVTLLGRWMLFDNLRRSLVPVSLLGLLLLGWLFLPQNRVAWTLTVALIPGLPVVYSLVDDFRRSTLRWGTMRSTFIRVSSNFGRQLGQWMVKLAVLPIVSQSSLDAIGRTLTRLFITRKRLLEWTPSAQSNLECLSATLAGSYTGMAAAPLAGSVAYLIVLLGDTAPLWPPVLLATGWLTAPFLAWYLGQHRERPIDLTARDRAELRKVARRTWQFYERFVGPETHWLPPDNLQEAPKLVLAERTSPTNIGLFLISTVAAYDLQYVGATGLLTRIDGTTSTMLRLRRFRGHLLNWYNTRDLAVLEPAYVSTVDSGNLLAALLICRNAILDMEDTPLPHRRAAAALGDIVAGIEDMLTVAGDRSDASTAGTLTDILNRIRHCITDTPGDLAAWQRALSTLTDRLCTELEDAVLHLAESEGSRWTAERIDAVRTGIVQLRYEAATLRAETADIARSLQCLSGEEDRPAASEPRTLGDYMQLVDAAIPLTAPPESLESSDLWPEPGNEVLRRSAASLAQLLELRDRLISRINQIIAATDFDFLFDADRQLFHIGYNNTTGELDPSYYDLLASEARTASLIAIAKRDVPISHWVHLGRPLRRLGGMRVVLSWSATAFEYLMPRLFMETPSHGLLDASCRAVIREQRKLGKHHRVPWGISESAFFELDSSGHYKYYAFGVDSLALRRPARQRYVVSPYASLLALPFAPSDVIANLRALRDFGCWGRYGFYEALDFGEQPGTAARPRVVRSYMAHHQAMSIAALANLLCGDSLMRRFHENSEIAAVAHLLHEALPRRAADRTIRFSAPPRRRAAPMMTSDHVRIAPDRLDRFVNLLGNGHLTVRTTARASGNAVWNDYTVTRWQPRTAGPMGGERTYLSGLGKGELHILGAEDSDAAAAPDCWCAPHETDLHQRFGSILARLSTCVAPDDDVALKRITLTNESRSSRTIGATHYAEPVLAPNAADQRHPAFNKLFIESEFVHRQSALVFNRRRRSAKEPGLSCAFSVAAPDEFAPVVHYTCDRRSFLGRTGSYRRPAALNGSERGFDSKAGQGLDPAAAIGVTLTIPAGATVQLVFITSVAPDRSHALELIDDFRSPERVRFAFDRARQRSAAELTELSIGSTKLIRLLDFYADMLWPQPFTDRAYARVRNARHILSALWSRGISGDYPICVLRAGKGSQTIRVEEMLALQNFLDRRMTPFDVILVDESAASYAESVRNRLERIIAKYRRPDQRGHAVVLASSNLSAADRVALDAAGLVHRDANAGDGIVLRERRSEVYRNLPDFVPVRTPGTAMRRAAPVTEEPALEFDNGYGGVDPLTGDYVVRADTDAPTPAPWINVLANPDFGCIISEAGSSSTWFRNSSEHRLTSWHNDPVADRSGEALYIRDEETGEFWSPTPRPVPGGERYIVRHGAGHSRFEHSSHDVQQRVDCFVDSKRPVKFYDLKLRETAGRPRRLTITYYVEWLFGNHYEDTSPYIISEIDRSQQILLARNAHPRFHDERVAFVTATAPLHGFTTNRREFLGAECDPGRPAALRRIGLSGDILVGAEPCCAFQVHLDLAAGEEAGVTFALGAAEDRHEGLRLAEAARSEDFVRTCRAATSQFWRDTLSRCQIRTPSSALDHIFNGWLPYQNLAARLWARTGLYQAAGGFGFRDQLQDSLALIHTQPQFPRAQIVRACGVQFAEGDVLHWWHEDPVRGVRTRCSDDLLWLPYAVSDYLRATGDTGLLDETVPYLAGDPLPPDENERYAEYSPGEQSASVYEHCCAAIEARAATGKNGLPFIGSGDWNDGLNRVGLEGRGESVWLGWFLADVYTRFAEIAKQRNDSARVTAFTRRRTSLLEAIEANAWDGEWYLRAFYDDGSRLGSAENRECRIDLNAQTWPVITGLGRPERAARALDSAGKWLVDDEARLIKLLAPPFDRTLRDPGYIKGYPPGIRENGGQYTHAATWAVWAAVMLNRSDLAMHWANLLNPLLRVTDRNSADRYRGEPYVLAGDVYGAAPLTGQSGWTWYTGSAGWFYRIILEQLLGFRPVRGTLRLQPCVPDEWPRFDVDYQVGESRYHFQVESPAAIAESGATFDLDGRRVSELHVIDDGADHHVVARPLRPGAENRDARKR